MSNIRRKYNKEQKLEIVKLSLNEDQSVVGLAERFNVSANTIYYWRRKYMREGEEAFQDQEKELINKDKRQIKQLKRQLREVQSEIEILKKGQKFITSRGG